MSWKKEIRVIASEFGVPDTVCEAIIIQVERKRGHIPTGYKGSLSRYKYDTAYKLLKPHIFEAIDKYRGRFSV